jgi:ribonuclease-3
VNEARAQRDPVELETALGHGFASRELLLRALTHRSLAHERAAIELSASVPAAGQTREEIPDEGDNERLEFLGDAVLGLVVAEALFKAHPEWHEGELTRVRAQLVSRKHMAEVAMAIGLGGHLRLSRGEERGGLRNKASVLSNSMEAVMGALFLDAGLQAVRDFARRHVMGEAAKLLAEELRSGNALGNYKSALQEFSQSAHAGTPVYKVKGESGPDHRKRFLVEVRLKGEDGMPGQPLAHGKGSTKKLAEQDAARRTLERLKAGDTGADATVRQMEEEEQGAE